MARVGTQDVSGYAPSGDYSEAVDVGTGSDRALVVMYHHEGPTSATDLDITYNGVSLTFSYQTTTSGGTPCGLAYLVAPASGSNTLELSRTSAGYLSCGSGVAWYDDTDQTNVFSATETATGSDATATDDIASATDEEVFGGCAFTSFGTETITPGSGQTLVAEQESASNFFCSSYEAGAATVTHSYTISESESWTIFVGSVQPAAAAGGFTPRSYPRGAMRGVQRGVA